MGIPKLWNWVAELGESGLDQQKSFACAAFETSRGGKFKQKSLAEVTWDQQKTGWTSGSHLHAPC